MSVHCVHGIQGKPAWERGYVHDLSSFLMSVYVMYIIRKCDKLAEMFIILSFKLDTQS